MPRPDKKATTSSITHSQNLAIALALTNMLLINMFLLEQGPIAILATTLTVALPLAALILAHLPSKQNRHPSFPPAAESQQHPQNPYTTDFEPLRAFIPLIKHAMALITLLALLAIFIK